MLMDLQGKWMKRDLGQAFDDGNFIPPLPRILKSVVVRGWMGVGGFGLATVIISVHRFQWLL
jgi:hypothetical protein